MGGGVIVEEFDAAYWESLVPSNGADSDPVTLDDLPVTTDYTGFAARVAGTRVDLLDRIANGIQPLAYIPGAEGRFAVGKRHLIPAPKKSGKSLTMLVDCVCMVEAGAHVVILDRENGGDLYANRLESIMAALEIDHSAIADRLAYYEFPRLRITDGDELAAMCAGADLVVFDSSRMFLTDLGLEENGNDDYATFVGAAIDPLFRAGIATVVLDNTGHQETGRGRGAAAKGDLNEVLFKMDVVEKFGLTNAGRVRLTITDSRFGNSGSWEMAIGGGHFEPWQQTEDGEAWEPTTLMARVSEYLAEQNAARSRTRIANVVTGKRQGVYKAIEALIAGGYATENSSQLIELKKPYGELVA